MNIPDEFGLFPFQRFTADELRHFFGKRKLTAVCSHQTRIGNLDAHLI